MKSITYKMVFHHFETSYMNYQLYIFLQGSAHSGPALTPVEVLTAIQDINLDKEGVALKKV